MADSLEVARTLRDKASSPSLREYWQQVMNGIERTRAQEKKS